MFQMFPSGKTHPQRFAFEFPTDRVIGSDKFTGDLRQVDHRLQERVALPQHHRGPCGDLGGLQPCGQALDALLQFGHCGEPTLLFEAAGGALEGENKTRWGGEKIHRWGAITSTRTTDTDGLKPSYGLQ